MDKRRNSKFPPGAAEKGRAIGAKLGGLTHVARGTGVCAPGMAARGYIAAGLSSKWKDDPVYVEKMRWRKTPWKSRRG